jgi:hypothetical protein
MCSEPQRFKPAYQWESLITRDDEDKPFTMQICRKCALREFGKKGMQKKEEEYG